jgi:hypothetical protein
LATPSKEARERAELKFRKKEIEARDASKAMADYKAGLIAQREKTARLKALREAKEAADTAGKAAAKAAGEAGARAGVRDATEAKANKMDAGKALGPVKRSARKQALAAERAE